MTDETQMVKVLARRRRRRIFQFSFSHPFEMRESTTWIQKGGEPPLFVITIALDFPSYHTHGVFSETVLYQYFDLSPGATYGIFII